MRQIGFLALFGPVCSEGDVTSAHTSWPWEPFLHARREDTLKREATCKQSTFFLSAFIVRSGEPTVCMQGLRQDFRMNGNEGRGRRGGLEETRRGDVVSAERKGGVEARDKHGSQEEQRHAKRRAEQTNKQDKQKQDAFMTKSWRHRLPQLVV